MMMMVFETGSTLVQCLCSSPVHKAVCQLLNLGILDFQTLFLFPSSDKHVFFFFPITASTFLLICCLHNINLIKLFTTLFLKTCPSKKIDYLASASLCSQPSNFFIYRWCPDFTFFLQSTEDGKLSLDLIPMPATLFSDNAMSLYLNSNVTSYSKKVFPAKVCLGTWPTNATRQYTSFFDQTSKHIREESGKFVHF